MKNAKAFYQAVAIVGGVFILLIKFYTYWRTGSNAIFTDALESIVNVVASSFALYSIWLSARPQDENHPYGHGKIEFLSIGLEGMLILVAGLAAIGKAVYNLWYPNELQALATGIWLSAATGFLNFLLAQLLLFKGRRLHSLSMQGDGKHLMTDVYSSIGLVLGLGLILLTDIRWIDSLVAILFGLLIIYSGYKLLRDAISGIMDETDRVEVQRVVDVLNQNRRENWIDVHNLRIIKYGHGLHIDCHATIPWYLNLEEAHHEVSLIDQLVNAAMPNEMEFFIHADPCEPPASCSICEKHDCPVRKRPFSRRVSWQISNVLPNKKHNLTT